MKENSYKTRKRVSVPQAQEITLAMATRRTGTERLPVLEALGRVLAEDAVSLVDIPAFDNAAMDGWAMRFEDLAADAPTDLAEVGVSLAGHPYAGVVQAGQCVRITTGAQMPAGADTVIQMEKTETAPDGRIRFAAGARRGDNVRLRAETIAANGLALAAGSRIHAGAVSVLSAAGVADVLVHKRPRVVFLSSGDELVAPGAPLPEGKIYDVNTSALGALVLEAGAEPVRLPLVADDPEQLAASLRKAASLGDVILTSGGVSVGEADFTGTVLARLGSVENWSVNIRPGRPMTVGHIAGTLLFGLPGNPIAAMTAFLEFVAPVLDRMQGLSQPPVTLLPAVAASPFRKRPGRTEFQRGIYSVEDGKLVVRSTGPQGSAIVTSMTQANCLVVIEEERGRVEPGETVRIQPLAMLRA